MQQFFIYFSGRSRSGTTHRGVRCFRFVSHTDAPTYKPKKQKETLYDVHPSIITRASSRGRSPASATPRTCTRTAPPGQQRDATWRFNIAANPGPPRPGTPRKLPKPQAEPRAAVCLSGHHHRRAAAAPATSPAVSPSSLVLPPQEPPRRRPLVFGDFSSLRLTPVPRPTFSGCARSSTTYPARPKTRRRCAESPSEATRRSRRREARRLAVPRGGRHRRISRLTLSR